MIFGGIAAFGARLRALAFPIALFAVTPSIAGEQPADPVRQAAVQAIKSLGLQPTLPHEPVSLPPEMHWHLDLPSWMVWILVAGMAGVLLYSLRDFLPGFISGNDDAWATGTGDPFGATARPGENRLAQADELAGQGRFVEAMHVLLLHCLAEIRRRLVVEFPDSLTSREILRSARLPERGRHALDRIVARVEWTYFGEHPAGRADYDSCRASAAELTEALETGVVA